MKGNFMAGEKIESAEKVAARDAALAAARNLMDATAWTEMAKNRVESSNVESKATDIKVLEVCRTNEVKAFEAAQATAKNISPSSNSAGSAADEAVIAALSAAIDASSVNMNYT